MLSFLFLSIALAAPVESIQPDDLTLAGWVEETTQRKLEVGRLVKTASTETEVACLNERFTLLQSLESLSQSFLQRVVAQADAEKRAQSVASMVAIQEKVAEYHLEAVNGCITRGEEPYPRPTDFMPGSPAIDLAAMPVVSLLIGIEPPEVSPF